MIMLKNLSLLTFFLLIISGCTKSDKDIPLVQNKKPDTLAAPMSEETFVCLYHPQERKNGPGKCPVCGREMVSLVAYDQDMASKNEEMKKKWKSYIGGTYMVIDLPVMKCSDCEQLIVNSLSKDKGILDFQVDIINHDVFLFYDPYKTKKDNIEKLVTDAGFSANGKKANPEAYEKLPECCK